METLQQSNSSLHIVKNAVKDGLSVTRRPSPHSDRTAHGDRFSWAQPGVDLDAGRRLCSWRLIDGQVLTHSGQELPCVRHERVDFVALDSHAP
jgi:hypothetical protein